MKKIVLLVFGLFLYQTASTQNLKIEEIQALTKTGIKKAYSASIRIWAYDTVKHQQAGPQFSGVVVSAAGNILTAAHVNTPGQTYLINFPSGKTGIAVGLGDIEFTKSPMLPDVAMMKMVTTGPWPYAEMGWSAALKLNEPVISISYPETLNQPLPLVRSGTITNVLNEYGFFQSTCKMEPGDSGGPIFDYLGRVIGLHSAINGDVDYEVPVDLYRKYWTALQDKQTYAALPEREDKIGIDPEKIITIPKPSDLHANVIKTAKEDQKNAVLISSSQEGKTIEIHGTLIKVNHLTYIVSKSSMIGTNLLLKLPKGRSIQINVRYRDKSSDLVLLEAVGKLKGGISQDAFVKDSINEETLGDFLTSVMPGDETSVVGIIGTKNFTLNKVASMGYLGAAVAFATPVAITVVQPGSPAGNADFQVGDQLVSINNMQITKPEDYGNTLMKYWQGDTVKFELMRKGTIFHKEIVLTVRPERPATHPADLFKGGKSVRRDGFNTVFAHNADVNPEQCGGPVIDMYGNFYGINIARFSRTSTVAIPAANILSFLTTALRLN
jgi:serine protease Do